MTSTTKSVTEKDIEKTNASALTKIIILLLVISYCALLVILLIFTSITITSCFTVLPLFIGHVHTCCIDMISTKSHTKIVTKEDNCISRCEVPMVIGTVIIGLYFLLFILSLSKILDVSDSAMGVIALIGAACILYVGRAWLNISQCRSKSPESRTEMGKLSNQDPIIDSQIVFRLNDMEINLQWNDWICNRDPVLVVEKHLKYLLQDPDIKLPLIGDIEFESNESEIAMTGTLYQTIRNIRNMKVRLLPWNNVLQKIPRSKVETWFMGSINDDPCTNESHCKSHQILDQLRKQDIYVNSDLAIINPYEVKDMVCWECEDRDLGWTNDQVALQVISMQKKLLKGAKDGFVGIQIHVIVFQIKNSRGLKLWP